MWKKGLLYSLLILCVIFAGQPVKASESHWAEKTLQKVLRDKTLPDLISLTEPDRPLTRAEFVSFLVSEHELTANTSNLRPFADCSSSDWFYEDVMTAQALGIAAGYPGGIFRPNDSITRQDAAVLLLLALEIQQIALPDVLEGFYDKNEISDYAQNAAAFLVKQGYLNGYGDQTLRPLASITVAEALTLDERIQKAPFVQSAKPIRVLDVINIKPVSGDFKKYEVTYKADVAASLYHIVKYDGAVPLLAEMDLLAPAWSSAKDNVAVTASFAAELKGEAASLWLLAVDADSNYIWAEAVFPLTKPDFIGGDGTAEAPFVITKVSELRRIAQVDYLNYHYILGEDLVLTGTWNPIGSPEHPFTGSFNGNGKVIRGLSIHSSAAYTGLFGYVDGISARQPAVIKNLSLVVNGISGSRYVGGVAGYLGRYSQIVSCAVIADKDQGYTATVYAFGQDSCVGGIVGQSGGNIVNCYFNGVVTGVSTGTEVVVGGIVGDTAGVVQNTYSTAAVTGVASSGNVYIGGIAGKAKGMIWSSLGINHSVSGSGILVNSGKIIGYDEGVSLLNCFGLADSRDIFLEAPNNGLPITIYEALYFDLYGQDGLNWDISDRLGADAAWLMDAGASYSLPILGAGERTVQKNQRFPEHLQYELGWIRP